MLLQKILATVKWSAACVLAAAAADYVITVVILNSYSSYAPWTTVCIAMVVALPISFLLVNGSYDLRRARDELAVARDAAINANVSKTLFFASMSHELRTPLNAILGFSQLLESDIFSAKRVEYARLIRSSGEHLLALVNDVLEISRLEAGKLRLKDEIIDVGDLVNECVKTMEPRARTARVRMAQRVASNVPNLRADRRAVKQVLLNLLTNAIKFSPEGTSVGVAVGLSSSGELEIAVADQGIGIPEPEQQSIFEPFKQVRHDALSVEEGTGLGLPIVKGLVEAHGGRIGLRSRQGEGTCVTIFLPSARCEPRPGLSLAS